MSRFITIEGIEGVGKSTAIQYIAQWLAQRQINALITREPGGTKVANQLRQIVLNEQEEPITNYAELLMIFAARAQHLSQVICPALKQGDWVICDRFTDSSYAYQGGGRNLPAEHIHTLEQWIQGDLRPDKVILLDAPVELCLQRMAKRDKRDRIESEKKAFFHCARDIYLKRASVEKTKYVVIDASLPLVQINNQLSKILQQLLEN